MRENRKLINSLRIFFILFFAVLVSLKPTLTNAQSEFIKYVNEDKFKHYENGVFLGMFKSQKEAEEFLSEKKLNPVTLEPYDVAFAFGMSGNKPWVKVWEYTRVIGDNLSWSPLTNYSKIEGLKFNNLVVHSNTTDIANNAIKAHYIKVDNLIALAPPAGFKDEIRNLFGVKSVEIYRTKGDPVAEVLGKKTLFGIMQKFGDLNIGMINKTDRPIIGIEVTRPWPDEVQTPKIDEIIFEGPYYFTKNPHDYETNASNVALKKMYSLDRIIRTADQKMISIAKINELQGKLEDYRLKFPVTIEKFDVPSYWTYKNRPQSLTEAQTMTEMTHEKTRILIVGKGPEADLMYKNMVKKLDETKVQRIDSFVNETTLQLEARKFGADVILGVKDTKLSDVTLSSSDGSSKQNLSGVDISPQLSQADTGGSETKEIVLKSRSSQNSLAWKADTKTPAKTEEIQASTVEGLAVSLRVLQQRLKVCLQEDSCSQAALLQLAGLRRIIGYVVDEANHDLILVGEKDDSLPPLYLEDFIIALKNTWMQYAQLKGNTYYYSNPGCSIDPDPRIINRLQTTGQHILGSSSQSDIERTIQQWHETCQSPQNVRVLGIPFDTRFAWVMVKADYDMKRLVDGSDSLGTSGFVSLTDMTLETAKKDIVQGRSISIPLSSMNRFWFYPGENRYLEDQGVITIEQSPVVLLTEEEYLGKKGKIVGKGHADQLAQEFVEDFTANYAELAKQRPIYTELENLFRFVALAKIMKYKDAVSDAGIDLDYLLESVQIHQTRVARQLPGRSNVKGFEHKQEFANGYRINRLWLPSCGGVGIEITFSQRNFLKDTSGRLAELKAMVLKARPTPDALVWGYPNLQKRAQ